MNCKKGEKFHNVNVDCSRIEDVSIKYMLNVKPTPLARPRMSRRRVYDSQKHDKMIMGIDLIAQHGNLYPYNGILHMDIDFLFPLPGSKSKSKLLSEGQYHHYKPDIDNLIKYILDVCVDSAILHDDCIVSSIFCRKIYVTEDNQTPRTQFTITQIK